MNMIFSKTKSLLALAMLALPLGAAQCDGEDKPDPEPERKTELRLSVAGTQPYAFGQTLPSAYVRLEGKNAAGNPLEAYSQVAPDGEYVAHSEAEEIKNQEYTLTVELRKAVPLMQAGTRVKAGVYLNGVLQKELELNASNVGSEPFVFGANGQASSFGDAVRSVTFRIP